MPDLDKLGLSESSAPPVDWDAPEAGKSPPAVYPGTYTFLFALPENDEDWFDAVDRVVVKEDKARGVAEVKRKFLELTYTPIAIANSQGQPIAAEDGSPLQLGPQRANTFMSQKMHIHQLGELLRGMGVRLEANFLAKESNGKSVIYNAVAQLNGKAQFVGEVIWRTYFKSTETTYSTHPRGKKSGELLWPRNAEGVPELMAKNTMTGETAFGYAEIARVKLPTSASGSDSANQQTLATGA